MKKILGFVLCVMLSVLPLSACSRSYIDAKEDSYSPYSGSPDIYTASREELIEMDLCDYPDSFGEVKSKREAAKIATTVVAEVYGKDESPYIVKYNENANAWIVRGNTPLFHAGGSASIAIDKESGEVIMLLHTK